MRIIAPQPSKQNSHEKCLTQILITIDIQRDWHACVRVRQVVQIHTEVFYCYALRIFEVSAWPNCDINQYYSVPIGRLGDCAFVWFNLFLCRWLCFYAITGIHQKYIFSSKWLNY